MVAVEGAGDYLSASDECKRGSRWDLWVRAKKDNKIYKHSDCLLRLRADYERASGSFYSASLKLVQWVS